MKTCESCGTENDDTRVFCMNCGTRLPAPGSLPGVPKTSAAVGASAPPISTFRPTAPIKKPGKIRQAGRGFFGTLVFFLPWFLLAGLGAAIFFAIQTPSDIPADAAPDPDESQRLVEFLQKASSTPGGAFQADQGAINRLLAAGVRLEPIANPFGVKTAFTRCYTRLSENRMDFTLQIEIHGQPVFLTLGFSPVEKNGRVFPEVAGAQIGRLPLPAPIASLLLPLWSPCFDSLENVIDLLRGAQSAKVEDGRIVFRWPGGTESPR